LDCASALLFDMHAADRLVELPPDTMVLNEIGGRAKLVVAFNNGAVSFIELEQKSNRLPAGRFSDPVSGGPDHAASRQCDGIR
jgi:hypothetical protein